MAGEGRTLQDQLRAVGYPGGYDDLMLFPGQQRQALVKWALSR